MSLIESLFNNSEENTERLKYIVSIWLKRRMTECEYDIIDSDIFGVGFLHIKSIHNEYLTILKGITKLKYDIQITVSHIKIFYIGDDPNNKFFTIPMNYMSTETISIINDIIKSQDLCDCVQSTDISCLSTFKVRRDKKISGDFSFGNSVHDFVKCRVADIYMNMLINDIYFTSKNIARPFARLMKGSDNICNKYIKKCEIYMFIIIGNKLAEIIDYLLYTFKDNDDKKIVNLYKSYKLTIKKLLCVLITTFQNI